MDNDYEDEELIFVKRNTDLVDKAAGVVGLSRVD